MLTKTPKVVVQKPLSGCYVTNFAPHRALKLIVGGKLTFDERFVVHREVFGDAKTEEVMVNLISFHQAPQ